MIRKRVEIIKKHSYWLLSQNFFRKQLLKLLEKNHHYYPALKLNIFIRTKIIIFVSSKKITLIPFSTFPIDSSKEEKEKKNEKRRILK